MAHSKTTNQSGGMLQHLWCLMWIQHDFLKYFRLKVSNGVLITGMIKYKKGRYYNHEQESNKQSWQMLNEITPMNNNGLGKNYLHWITPMTCIYLCLVTSGNKGICLKKWQYSIAIFDNRVSLYWSHGESSTHRHKLTTFIVTIIIWWVIFNISTQSMEARMLMDSRFCR